MPVFESDRKIQVLGSSLAVTLPSMFVKVNELEKGNKMKVFYGLEGVLIVSRDGDTKVILERLMKMLDILQENEKKAVDKVIGEDG